MSGNGDYISREAAIELLKMSLDDDWEPEYAADRLSEIPGAYVRPVVRGRWIDEPIKGIRYHCSVCQGRFNYTWHYCPNCGADMREES